MKRLELEQQQRHSRENRAADVLMYDAETRRIDSNEDRALQKSWGNRAERVLYLLVGVALLLVFTGHTEVGLVVLGTTLVAVIGSFLQQRSARGAA